MFENVPENTFNLDETTRTKWRAFGMQNDRTIMAIIHDRDFGYYPFYLDEMSQRQELYQAYKPENGLSNEYIVSEYLIESDEEITDFSLEGW
ncbi:MAG: hypothetical protein HWD84_10505 [Flavobacteriaceae bacterium]|nr:hypothetical protein [Flavobacteriaceae bacterium]